MWTTKIWYYLKGYAMISIIGDSTENFMNQCNNRGIPLWELQKTGRNELRLKVDYRHLDKLTELAAKCGLTLTPLYFTGPKAWISAGRKNKCFLIGMLFFFLVMTALADRIWIIEVEGVKPEEQNYVMELFQEYDLKPGVKIEEIPVQDLLNQIVIKSTRYIWAGIEVDGTKVHIKVAERINPPELDSTIPCDVVADKDGRIESIVVLQGEAAVKPGDMVKTGDILINGYLRTLFYQEVRGFVHGDGIVTVRRWYDAEGTIKKNETLTLKTGNEKKKYFLKYKDNIYALNPVQVEYENYEETISYVKLPEFLEKIGMELQIVTYRETRQVKNKFVMEDALKAFAKTQVPEGASVAKVTLTEKEESADKIRVKLVIETLEEIGKKVELTEAKKQEYMKKKETKAS